MCQPQSQPTQTEKGRFVVDPFASLPDLSQDDEAACLKESPPQEDGSFGKRLMESLDVSVSETSIEIQGGAEF